MSPIFSIRNWLRARFFLLVALTLASGNLFAQSASGYFENPVDGATESGISVISGWHCTASEITVTVDGTSLGKAGSGTERPDTTSVCGRSDTGFSLLYNWNNLSPGQHVVNMYANGALFGMKTINTVQSAGQPFAQGLSGGYKLSGFPSSSQTTTIEWREAKQSFVITKLEQTGPAVDLSSLNGSSGSTTAFYTVSGAGCAALGFQIGKYDERVNISAAASGSQLTFNLYSSSGYYIYTLNYQTGDKNTGFNFSGTFRETVSGISGTATVLSLKKNLSAFGSGSYYTGFLTGTATNCTFAASLS